jgi:hypothetical protein
MGKQDHEKWAKKCYDKGGGHNSNMDINYAKIWFVNYLVIVETEN